MDNVAKIKKSLAQLNFKIFIPAALIIGSVILYGALDASSFAELSSILLVWCLDNFVWLALIVGFMIAVVCVWWIVSPFGKTIIGGPDVKPEYSNFVWVTMIICGNIGIAMMFYAVVEPLGYFYKPPAFWNVDAQTDTAVEMAIAQTAFHWGGITQAANTFIGLMTIILCMNYGLPFRPSTALYPILKGRIFGWMGTTFDIMALIGIICAITTGFGLGVMQFSTGLSYVTGITLNNGLYTIVIVLTTLVLVFSSFRGFKKGLAIFSQANAYMYLAILIFLLSVGPTFKLMELLVGSLGALIDNFIPMALNGDFLGEGDHWNSRNTGFTWFWFAVYSPFTGMFLGKISRGRMVRSCLLAVVGIQTLFLLLWFVLWGGNAVNLSYFLNYDLMAVIGEWGAPVANFVTLEYLPLKWLFIPIVLVCVMIGFITLVDALSNIIAGVCMKKVTNFEAPSYVRSFWCIMLGALTLICLFALDQAGISALQGLTAVTGLPMMFTALVTVIGGFIVASGATDAYLSSTKGKLDIEKAKLYIGNTEIRRDIQ